MGNSGAMWAVIVIILVGIVGWIAYTQGFFMGEDAGQENASINVELPGSQE